MCPMWASNETRGAGAKLSSQEFSSSELMGVKNVLDEGYLLMPVNQTPTVSSL